MVEFVVTSGYMLEGIFFKYHGTDTAHKVSAIKSNWLWLFESETNFAERVLECQLPGQKQNDHSRDYVITINSIQALSNSML